MPNPSIDQVFGTDKKKIREKWVTEQVCYASLYQFPISAMSVLLS